MSHNQPVKLIFCFVQLVDFDRNGTERLGGSMSGFIFLPGFNGSIQYDRDLS